MIKIEKPKVLDSSRTLDLCTADLPAMRPQCAYPNPIRGRNY